MTQVTLYTTRDIERCAKQAAHDHAAAHNLSGYRRLEEYGVCKHYGMVSVWVRYHVTGGEGLVAFASLNHFDL